MAQPLTSVPAPAEPERKPRTFPELVTAIYEDPRVGHESRELLLAVGYGLYLAERPDGENPLRIARRKLGVEHGRQARYDRLIADDAPRYKPRWQDSRNRMPSDAACRAPRLRPYKPRPYKPRTPEDAPPEPPAPTPIRPYQLPPELAALKEHAMATYTAPRDWRTEDGICGSPARHRVEERDPRTGWITAHWFCKRHKDHADRVTAQLADQNAAAPEPVPNTGGLLPCYFKADWAKVYAHYRHGWTEPSYGLCADDWPAVDQALPGRAARRGLRAITDLDTTVEGPK
jgi:hypothetical protein